jgi:hypothetical protein
MLFAASDRIFAGTGRMGVWTKSDSLTQCRTTFGPGRR